MAAEMRQRIALTGGTIALGESGAEEELYIADGRIVGRGSAPDGFSADVTIDATGQVIYPAFVDLACRLGRHDRTDVVRQELVAAASGGLADVLVPPMPGSRLSDVAVVESLMDAAGSAAGTRVHLLADGARSLNGHAAAESGLALSEMAALAEAGAIGIWLSGAMLRDALLLRRTAEYARDLSLPLFVQPTDPGLAGPGCAHEGAMATRLGLPSIPTSAETAAMAVLLETVADTGTHLHFGRISSAAGADIVRRAKARGLPVSADVSIHHLLLTDDALDGFNAGAHLQPPLRSAEDRDALVNAVNDGSIDAICSDHVPLGTDAKQHPFPSTAPGSAACEWLVPLVADLCRTGVLDDDRLIECLVTAPGRWVGRPSPTLAAGDAADICVLADGSDGDIPPQAVHGTGKSTALAGLPLSSRVMLTIIDGCIRYSSDH